MGAVEGSLSRQLLRWLQLGGDLLAVLQGEGGPGGRRGAVPAAGAQGRGASVSVRLLRRGRERVRRLPLLAGPPAVVVVRSSRLGLPVAGRRGALPGGCHRSKVLRPRRQELRQVRGAGAERPVRLGPEAPERAARV